MRRIALVNLEPKVENTVYMQISQYHKQQGNSVEWYSPLFHKEYDKIYCSSLFDFTDKNIVTADMECGGTGFKELIAKRLPPEIEACDLDYSLYPRCRTSYIWFSRGCPNNHDFCVVPQKEGKLRCVQPKKLNPKGTRISVMDDSFTAMPYDAFWDAVKYLENMGMPVDFQCGVDCRIYTPERWVAIARHLKLYHQIKTAWDIPSEDLRDALKQFASVFGASKVMVYVLIGYNSTPAEDLMRVLEIRKLGLDAYVMPFNRRDDQYQRAFQRWNNGHAACVWKDYEDSRWVALSKLRGA